MTSKKPLAQLRKSGRHGKPSGAATVEFAIVGPILKLLLRFGGRFG
jgi:Flp pilus assembly protein TadG